MAFRPDELGHRVRDERPPVIPADKWESAGVVIVGAGIAGLSAARRLLASGYEDFVVLELESAPGGTARSGANGDERVPVGRALHHRADEGERRAPRAAPRARSRRGQPTPRGEPIFREEVLCREPQERVFADGAWHDGLYLARRRVGRRQAAVRALQARPSSASRRCATRRAAARSRSRPRAAPTTPTLTALDKTSIAEWLAREKLTSERLRWLVDYACRDDFGARAAHTSAWAGIHYYASRLLGPGREPQAVLTWPEGNGWLVGEAPREAPRASCALGLAVADVAPVRRTAGVDVIAIGARADARSGIHAERVIFAAPQFVARARGAPVPRGAARASRRVRVRRVDGREHHARSARPKRARRGERAMAWDNVLRDSPSLGYVVRDAPDRPRSRPDRAHVLPSALRRGPARRARGVSTPPAATSGPTSRSPISSARIPTSATLATRIDVVRWGHAMVRPSPGFVFGGARAAAARPLQGIHFAHTDLSGVALFEEAFHHGVRAADEALAASAAPSSLASVRSDARPREAAVQAAGSSRATSTSRSSSAARRVSFGALGIGALAGVLDDETPGWAWVPAVILCDVAHVWSTALPHVPRSGGASRAPVAPRARADRSGFAAGVALFALGELAFWRALAYLAIFHFVRQQYGWVSLYRARAGETGRARSLVDTAAIYAATLWPLLHWHTHLPRRFSWFVAGDVVRAAVVRDADRDRALRRRARRVRACAPRRMWLRGTPNPGKDVVVVDDGARLVRRHRRVRLGLRVHRHERVHARHPVLRARLRPRAQARDARAPARDTRALRSRERLTRHVLVYLAVLWLIAFVEELVWDRAVWHDRGWLFGEPGSVGALKLVIVPLLALPQLTHYVLDGFIWRRRSNPSVARLVDGPAVADQRRRSRRRARDRAGAHRAARAVDRGRGPSLPPISTRTRPPSACTMTVVPA